MTAGIPANVRTVSVVADIYIVYISTFYLTLQLYCNFKFNPNFLHNKANLKSTDITISLERYLCFRTSETPSSVERPLFLFAYNFIYTAVVNYGHGFNVVRKLPYSNSKQHPRCMPISVV